MKAKLILIFLFILLSSGNLLALDSGRKVELAQGDLQLVLTKSLYDQTLAMDEPTRRLVYVSYISGFLDAMLLNAAEPDTARKFIDECNGLTLGELQGMMIKFKNENSQIRFLTPAYTLTNVIPRVRKGLSGLPGDEERK
jgi:hypothetical protein